MRRKEFIFNKETGNKEEYVKVMARYIAAARRDEAVELSDGSRVVLTREELTELEGNVMTLIMPDIKEAAKFRSMRAQLNYDKTEEFESILMEVVYTELPKYNDKSHLTEDKQYHISTFITFCCRMAMRKMLCEERGLPVEALKNLKKINDAIQEIHKGLQVSYDNITPEMVYDYLQEKRAGEGRNRITMETVYLLMDIRSGYLSIEEMEADEEYKGKQFVNPEESVFDEANKALSEQDKEALDTTIGSFSKLELFLLIQQFGLLEKIYEKKTIKELAMDDYFVELVSADKLGAKHITCKSITIERAKGSKMTPGVYENIRCVDEKFIHNKIAKIQQVLAKLGTMVAMADTADWICDYCVEKWKEVC